MADPVTTNTHDDVPSAKKLDELHRLIDGIAIAMLTTRAADGGFNARPMATQEHSEGADVWFMTSVETQKVAEIEADSDVNVAYVNGTSREWVSISGTATIDRDRERIRRMYKPDWKAWFEDLGGDRNGGPNDPRIVLIDVRAHHVTYFKLNEPRPIVLLKIARAALSRSVPKVGDIRHLGSSELG